MLSQHIAILREQGMDISEFMPPPLPRQVTHIWNWFNELCAGRPSTGTGHGPISHSEILAWSTLKGVRLGKFELDCIRGLDHIFLKVVNNV